MILILLLGLASATPSPPSSTCSYTYQCNPPPACHMAVGCVNTACVYERLPIDQCCLTSNECCEYAGPHQVGICDKNCTCQFVSSLQCVRDSDCDGLLSSTICTMQGQCFYSHCDAGLCQCLNGTGLDIDCDNVTCPDDCNDRDATVSRKITCIRDQDGDDFPSCTPDDDDDDYCIELCVEPDATCPLGYIDPTDPLRGMRPRTMRQNGTPCTVIPQINESLCDCCDEDLRAFPGSPYVGSAPNNCGEPDYNCDGDSTPHACCDNDGLHDEFANVDRYLWYAAACFNVTDECGGCSTEYSAAVLVLGWACETECAENAESVVPEGACPAACNDVCQCVDEVTPPLLGECGKMVTNCAHVRSTLYADVETCCVATVQ